MFGLFGPRVPKTLYEPEDFARLERVLSTRSAGKIRKALALVERSGFSAKPAVPLVEPFLDQPAFAIPAARALWAASRSPRAVETIKNALNAPEQTADPGNPHLLALRVLERGAVLLAFSRIASDEKGHIGTLIQATAAFLDTLAGACDTGDVFDKVISAVTSGDDNKAARYAAGILAEIARDHPAVKEQLAAAVGNPKNQQQAKYAALALGFTCYADARKMKEQIAFTNTFFDHPDIAMLAARNKIRDEALAAGFARAKQVEQRQS